MRIRLKSAGIRQSNARWPIGTARRQRAVNFLSLDWGGDMRFGSIRAAAALGLLFSGILGSSVALAQTSPARRFELAPDAQPLRDVCLATQPVPVFLKMA